MEEGEALEEKVQVSDLGKVYIQKQQGLLLKHCLPMYIYWAIFNSLISLSSFLIIPIGNTFKFTT